METGLVLVDGFRDRNVPASEKILYLVDIVRVRLPNRLRGLDDVPALSGAAWK